MENKNYCFTKSVALAKGGYSKETYFIISEVTYNLTQALEVLITSGKDKKEAIQYLNTLKKEQRVF